MNSTFGSFPTALKIPAHINGVHMLVISVLFESNSSFFFSDYLQVLSETQRSDPG